MLSNLPATKHLCNMNACAYKYGILTASAGIAKGTPSGQRYFKGA